MKLATTMGVELTFSPAILDRQIKRFKGEKVFGKAACHVNDSDLCSAFATMLRRVLEHKKIPHYGCSMDPSVVEVPTKPYINSAKLHSAMRRIMREASMMDLNPVVDWMAGGGAHIHTGVLFGRDRNKREAYKARMNAFAAMNPWLAWAHLNVVDDINAEPMSTQTLFSRANGWNEEDLERMIQGSRDNVIQYTNHAHAVTQNERYRRMYLRDAEACRSDMARWRLKLHRMRSHGGKVAIDVLAQNIGKGNAIRFTGYGSYGTIEFRFFEMREDASALLKHIMLTNAIVEYVRDSDMTHVNKSDLFTKAQLDSMPYSVRKAGFHRMLRTLGIDPADYRSETVQMALRMRHKAEERRQTAREQAAYIAEQQRASEERAQLIAARQARREAEARARDAQQGTPVDDLAGMAA